MASRASLSPALTDYLARLGQSFRVLPGPHKSYARYRDTLRELNEAMLARETLRIRYRTGGTGAASSRSLDPYRVWYRSGGLYVVGFDHRSREIRTEPLGQALSLISTVSLTPQPIPLEVKVVLVGPRIIYYLLHAYDPEFAELFKVAADFEDDFDRGPAADLLYARVVATIARREQLRPLDREAVAQGIEYAARAAGAAEKLSANLESLSDLLRESDYWAGKENAELVATIALEVQALGKVARLPLIALAAPTLKSLAPAQRAAFLVVLQRLIAADQRVTLEEFVVAAMLEAALGERAGRAVAARYRTLEPLAADAQLILSLIAHATNGEAAASFDHGLKELGFPLMLLAASAVSLDAVKAALARLNQLALMQKPRLVKALVQCALADGTLSLTDAELLRAICSTLDSPLPPFLEAMPYAA